MGTKQIQCDGVSLSYEKGKEALQGITFSMKRGTNLGLIGPIGSGKTTLLRILAGILEADGRIEMATSEPAGYMPALGGLINELTVRENLASGLPYIQNGVRYVAQNTGDFQNY